MTGETVLREILRECADQIAANVEVVWMSDDAEGPHQLRVGLRRLRSILAMFADIVRCDELDRLDKESRWLAKEVGELRDLDVVRRVVVDREIERHPAESALASLASAIDTRAVARREALCLTLVAPRAQSLLHDLTQFIETRGWLLSMKLAQTTQLAMPVRDCAYRALEKRWRKVVRRGRRFRILGDEERHDLRKELKKLRYTVEFFADLYKTKRVKPMVRRLKKLQNIFGALNDAQMARTILESADLASPLNLQGQRAVGWVLGASQARAEVAWPDARKQWRKFKSTEPFWR